MVQMMVMTMRDTAFLFDRDEVNAGFEISNIRYDDVKDDTKDALEEAFKNLIAAGIDIPKSYIDIYMSSGSLKVLAKIQVGAANKSVASVQSSIAEQVTPTKIVDEVKKAPGIADAVDGSLDDLVASAPEVEVVQATTTAAPTTTAALAVPTPKKLAGQLPKPRA